MTELCVPGKLSTFALWPLPLWRRLLRTGSEAGLVGTAILLSSQTFAQQTVDEQSQMPQAPMAPSVQHAETMATSQAGNATFSQPNLGGRLELNLGQHEAQDQVETLNQDGTQDKPPLLQRDTAIADIQLTLEIEQPWGSAAKIVGQLELNSRRYGQEALNNDDEEFSYDLERFYFEFNPSDAIRARVGRQGIDDPMESIIDENLDGIRLEYDAGQVEYEFSHTREKWFEASTFSRVDDIANTMVQMHYSPNKDSVWMPYVLHRSTKIFNGSDPAETTWAGLQGIVKPKNSNWRYWVHGSAMTGEEQQSNSTETVDLGGFALDLGINWTAPVTLEPTFTFAVAHATGGELDERYRQSGLHSNNFALNGKNSFRYLGEVVDPELTNIQIITLGAGMQLSDKWSTDLALHSYTQVETENNLRGSDIEYDPLGANNDLGVGGDLILAYEPNKQLDIKGTAGFFAPGDAFKSNMDTAWLVLLEVDYNF